jgi:hypothetical protein
VSARNGVAPPRPTGGDPARVGRDAGRIAEEIVQHVVGLAGTEVEIHLEMEPRIPDGAPENVVGTVAENWRTLNFKTHGFEEV